MFIYLLLMVVLAYEGRTVSGK